MRRHNSVLNGKKGNIVLDTLLVPISFFVLAILAFVSIQISDDINTDLQADDSLSNSTKERLDTANNKMPSLMDNIFISVLVFLFVFVIAASLFVDVNPLFLVLGIVLFVILFIVGGYMANSYEELADDGSIGDPKNTMPKTYWVMTHFIETLIIIVFSMALALYGKTRMG